MRQAIWIGAAICTSAFLLECAHDLYSDATSKFATATVAESTAFQGDITIATTLCKRRATFDFMFNRISGNPAALTSWSSWYSTKQIPMPDGSTETWKDHCTTLASGDTLALRAMQSLSSYAQALQTVSTGGAYDGGSLATADTDISTLVGDLASKTSPAATAVKDLAAPIATLGSVIVQTYAASELKKSIADSNDAVTKILGALSKYDDAVGDELRDAKDLLKQAMDGANTKLGAAPPAEAVLTLTTTAENYRNELQQFDDALSSHQKALDDLKKAHDTLYQGATTSMNASDVVKLVQQYATDVGTILSGVRNAVGGGKDGG